MGIVGLTDRKLPSFPQIGVLRKGDVKPNDKQPGKDLTYFRFDSDDAEAVRAFSDVYGSEPRSIRVFLPFPTIAENFDAWQEAWVAGGLQHRCDGQTCVRWLKSDGKYSDVPKPCPGGCKPAGRLKVIIPELRRLAYVMVLTTSVHDILNITDHLEALELARGDLRGIPMILRRYPEEISTPSGKDGSRARREKWLIAIEAAPQWVDLQIAAQQHAALPMPAPLALPAPEIVEVNTDTGEVIEAEASYEAPAIDPRKALVGELQLIVGKAVGLGLDTGLNGRTPRDMSDDEIRQALTTITAMVNAEYAAIEVAA